MVVRRRWWVNDTKAHEGPERGHRIMRSRSALSGIAYAVLTVIGIILFVFEEIDTSTDADIVSHYTDSGNRTRELVAFFLVVVGVMFFLWFLSTLRTRLRSVEPEPGSLSALAFGAGVTACALLVGAATALTTTSLAAEASSSFSVDPNLARSSVNAGYLLLMGASLVSCVVVVATSLLALRTEVFPNWLGWAGLVMVVLAIVEVLLLPVFVIPIWVVVVSVVSLTTESSVTTAPNTTTEPARSPVEVATR
jgi:hypothetical protein